MKWLKWFAIAWGAALSIALFSVAPLIHAQSGIADPDSMLIDSARAYSGVINSGDMLVVINYEINYSTLPSLAATDAFLCRFFVSGSEVNASEIVAFNDLGYGLGVCSMYFTAADLTAAGIEYNNPNAEDYEVVVQGKPSAFADPPIVQSASIDYRPSGQTAQYLESDISNLAQALQNDADWIANGFGPNTLITFTNGQQVLTEAGTAYFGQAIPNLQIMVPEIFGSATTTPEIQERDYQFSERDRLQTLWDSSIFAPYITGMASGWNLSKTWILSLMGIGIMVLFFFVAQITTNDQRFAMLTLVFTLPLTVAMGFGTMTAVFFVAAVGIIGLMFSLFLRRAG